MGDSPEVERAMKHALEISKAYELVGACKAEIKRLRRGLEAIIKIEPEWIGKSQILSAKEIATYVLRKGELND